MSEGLLPGYFRGFLVVKGVQVGSVVVRSSGSRVSWIQVQTWPCCGPGSDPLGACSSQKEGTAGSPTSGFWED